jgi:hypothetical protein
VDNLTWLIRIIGFENTRRLVWVVCFFKGHDFKSGETVGSWEIGYGKLTPDYCDRCCFNADEIDLEDHPLELPSLLNRAYSWVVEREWRWFEALDQFITDRIGHKNMPRWWRY